MQLPLPIEQLSRPLKLRDSDSHSDSDRRNRTEKQHRNPHRFPIEMANICRDKCLLKCGNYKTNVRKSIPQPRCFFRTFANIIRTQVCAHFESIVSGVAPRKQQMRERCHRFRCFWARKSPINPWELQNGSDFIAQWHEILAINLIKLE